MTPNVFTRDELINLLVALYLADVQRLALQIVSAALGIAWVEVLVRAGRMIEGGET